jgi:hypothetical protein
MNCGRCATAALGEISRRSHPAASVSSYEADGTPPSAARLSHCYRLSAEKASPTAICPESARVGGLFLQHPNLLPRIFDLGLCGRQAATPPPLVSAWAVLRHPLCLAPLGWGHPLRLRKPILIIILFKVNNFPLEQCDGPTGWKSKAGIERVDERTIINEELI